jgi:GTP-binding protein EngB required for normal cell division
MTPDGRRVVIIALGLDQEPRDMDLRQYEQIKFRLAELLRSSGASDSRLPQEMQNRGRELFSRLAEDRFNLVVVGRFSRGKSSLMNAVFGIDRLPTGIRPLTSVITTVTYGSKEKAVIRFAGLSIPEEIPLAKLPQYVTEQGNSGNYRRVTIAEVQLPVELLRRGFHFIDTPGLGSPIVENTRTTERFLPEADAFVLVTSFEGPLSEEEVRFLRTARQSGKAVFVVVNKLDMATPAEREEALGYLRGQLHGLLDGQGLGIFALSARDGLAAKQKGDQSLLAASGLPAFESELVRFLIDDKSRHFLLGICQRAGGLMAELPRAGDAAQLGQRLSEIAKDIGGGAGTGRALEAVLGVASAAAVLPTQTGPCEICGHVVDRCFDFLRHFQYEIIVSPERQRQLAERGGLCSFHTWIYEQMASPQGTCAGYATVLDQWASTLTAAAAPLMTPPAGTAAPNRMGIPASPVCLLCDARTAAESAAVTAIAARLRQHADQTLTSLSELCLPHLRLLVGALGDIPVTAKLLARQAAMLRRMAEDMRRYALKHDGLRRYLASDEETRAAERALTILAGHRALNTPAPRS